MSDSRILKLAELALVKLVQEGEVYVKHGEIYAKRTAYAKLAGFFDEYAAAVVKPLRAHQTWTAPS